ncbi:MAG: hypothetical protein LBI15_07685 [Dysgonamonadaceae bacterium]|jgi:hypothetical protein|nr:hypothetical protein [Dysgonamonadaceae bacterium]
MEISGKITGIKYKISFSENLKEIDFEDFNINECPAYCLVKNKANSFAISKWVSPKRTRSYPYERVYNTLNTSKKITIIPIVKDEGARGDRDFLQWDTVSLMSLLDVFVIFAYYEKAEISPRYENKITNQQFNNDYVIAKIKEIEQYHSSALHWNLNELNNNLHDIIDKAKTCYAKIENNLGVKLHNFDGLDNFKKKIGREVETFMQFSREKAKKAQVREMLTTQPKENLSTFTKAKITITNYLGGQYFFTVDEILIENDIVYLIESKHSTTSVLPSKGDIKDGLLKMILYSNLCDVEVDGLKMKSKAVLKLTSSKMQGAITEKSFGSERAEFIFSNDLKGDKQVLTAELFREAEDNGFEVKIGNWK